MRKRSLLLTMVLFVLLSQGCKLVPSFETHEFKTEKSIKPDRNMRYWAFKDLIRDGIDELLVAEEYKDKHQPFLINNQNTNNYSQITISYPLMSYSVISNRFDKHNWLFISFNNNKRVFLQGYICSWDLAFSRQNIYYQPIERTDPLISNPDYQWYGSLTPMIIEDIDNDGEVELVCRGNDGYTSNPRGIFVFNLRERTLKWRLDTAANITSLVWYDFDLDGKKDLVFTTTALKNNSNNNKPVIINGTDDWHTSIIVCNAHGKIIFQENSVYGFGRILLHSTDINNDGETELIRCDQSWDVGQDTKRNSVYIMKSSGKEFIKEKVFTAKSSIIRNYELHVSSLTPKTDQYIILADKEQGLIVLDKELNPRKHDNKFTVQRIEAVEDIDNDNNKEIILVDEHNDFLVLNSRLKVTARVRNPYPQDSDTRAMIVKNGEDKPRKIAIACHTGITYYNYSHLPWYLLIWRWIKSWIYIIAVFLFLVSWFLFFKTKKQSTLYNLLSNQTQTGVLLFKKNKIRFFNPHFKEYLFNETLKEEITSELIKKQYPQLMREITLFELSKSLSSAKEISLGGDEKTRYQLFMHKLKGIPNKTLVLLTKITANTEQVADKLEWAVTSRRLAHHVRRHLTNILNSLYLIDSEASKEEQNKYIEIIRAEVEDVRLFTHAFQRFTELGEYKLQEVDIVPYVENSIKKFIIPPNIRLIKDWTLKSLTAKIETTRFEEVITNLVTNAVDAMQGGGVLKISLSEKKEPDGKNYVLVEVEDTGQGIPKDKLEEIWEPFYTTKQNGTGIGLPEVKKTLRSMQAEIDLISEEGVGTTVSILLKGAEV